MAHWLMVVIALTYLSGLTSPSPTSMPYKTRETNFMELITELMNITNNQKDTVCNGSMVWSVNLTGNEGKEFLYCAALESLRNVSNCSVLQKTRKLLKDFCILARQAGVPPPLVRHTKIELKPFLKVLLNYIRHMFRTSR
ncbi:interleukin-13 [Suncus etruscus]|uniref:interleukin-13 n=1 Tax=Suncus etruscus TaxID=109475 RepID=UPI00210F3FFD|nr:interleukin-13 [Suncus etruscus]